MEEIFERLDANEAEIEKTNEETITIKVKLSKRYSSTFILKKIEKNENQKYSELLNIITNLKKNQENEINFLKNRISFLENLLKAKNNKDYKKGLESFRGSIIEMTCIGKNEFINYFDMNQEYVGKLKDNEYSKKNPNFFSFVFKCKDDKDIPFVVESFKKIKNDYSDDLFTRVKDNKLFVEVRFDADDLFELMDLSLDNICFSSGESLLIKTEAIPKDMFEEFNEEKILKFLLGTEIEFTNLSPQLQIFANLFKKIAKKLGFPSYLQDIIKDIYLNLVNGNYKFKIQKNLIEENIQTIYENLNSFIYDFAMDILEIKKFKEYKKINFNELEFNLISTKFKAGFNYKVKVPDYNELINDFMTEKVRKH